MVRSQATREKSVLVNIKRDFPRQDTRPEQYAQLMLCLFKPLFAIDDLRLPEETSYSDALQRTEDSNEWDPALFSMRSNIRAMLTQRLAADEETARRRAELLAARERGEAGAYEVNGDVFNLACDDDDTTGTNVLPTATNAHRVSAYVNDALGSVRAAGFSFDDSPSTCDTPGLPPPSLLSGRTHDQVQADRAEVRLGQDEIEAQKFMSDFAAKLAKADTTACAAPPEEPPVHDADSYNPATMEPYIRDLRSKSQSGLAEEAKNKMNERIRATNERVAATDVGRASVYQYDAINRIAEEFGLNRKQRLAFFIFGNAWMARNGSPNPNALRLHVSGGAGSGKSYVLAAINSLIECPALKGVVQPGGLLTVAFQSKQVASVGGSTVHSVCDIGTRQKGTMDKTDGQAGLSANKTQRWAQLMDGAIAMEEVSMISCKLLGKMHEAAVSVRPSGASLPHAGYICVTFGDLNQLEPVGALSVSHGAADSTRLDGLSNTQRVGRANFMAANASVVLDETNNRFSPTYAPIMNRLLHGECTFDDLDKINARVIGGPIHLQNASLGMTDCWMAQTITFRNKVFLYAMLFQSFAVLFFVSLKLVHNNLPPTDRTPDFVQILQPLARRLRRP